MATYHERCAALAVALAADVPVILWGGPGVGKTSVLEQVAGHHGWWLETVIASISDPTDFKGMPREEAGRTVFAPPAWAAAIADAGGGLVFLDEISTAPPSVQAALLRPVLGRVVGDLALPAGTRFVAAANPPDTAADGWDLSAPLANRFLHLDWEVPAAVISDGFVYGFDPIPLPTLDEAAVAAHSAEVLARVGAFLRARPDLAHQMPRASADQGVAWPSPRSWAAGARVLAYARAASAGSGVQSLLLHGSVGAAASAFFAWERALDLPDVEQALRDGGRIVLPATPDRVLVVCGALVSAVLSEPTRKRCEAAVNGVLLAVCESGQVDLATVALRRIADAVRESRAEVSPEAMIHFAGILSKMGRFPGSRGRSAGTDELRKSA